MANVQWEWKFGPASIIGGAQLIALLLGIGIVWGGAQNQQATSDKTIAELKTIVTTLTNSQAQAAERVTKVETKVDLMLPALQRIEARQMSRDTGHN